MRITFEEKDELIMRLVNYFITEENYTPIVVNGVRDEIWLQNTSGPYKIIRINSNYIHNKEQYDFDIYKVKNVMKQVKRKTLSFTMNALNILLDVNENVKMDPDKSISSVFLRDVEDVDSSLMMETFPNMKDKLLLNENGIQLILDVTNKISRKTEKENEKYENIFKPKKLIVTPILLFINVALFLMTYLLSKGNLSASFLVHFGALYAPYVKLGEVWRLVTSGFLHGGILHLIFNMYALYLIGTQMENFVGKWKFLFIYFVSMITGSLMSVVLNPNTVSIGASGAIFGLLGALLYFGYYYRVYLGSVLRSQIIPVILLNLLLGFLIPGVDNFAHIGGIIGGVLASMACGVQKENKNDQINGIIVLILYFIFFCYLLFFR